MKSLLFIAFLLWNGLAQAVERRDVVELPSENTPALERKVEEIRMERTVRDRMRMMQKIQSGTKESRVTASEEKKSPAAPSADVWRQLEKSVEISDEF